jgi:predicted permease
MRPPRLALWLHERSLHSTEKDVVIGDLLEEFDRLSAADAGSARRWFWMQTLRSILPNLRRRFSYSNPTRDVTRAKGVLSMTGVMTDIRFALRLARRDPLAVATAFLSLGAALALNILLFTLANAVMFRPLPVKTPSELVVVVLQRPTNLNHNFSHPDYVTLRSRATLATDVIAYAGTDATLGGSAVPAVIKGEFVSGNFFRALGISIVEGRPLGADDDRANAPPAVVISHRLWRDRFGSATIGEQAIVLNGQPFTIVGVAGNVFSGMQLGDSADFWVPLAHSPGLTGRSALERPDVSWLTLLARIPNAGGREAARQELDSIVKSTFEARGRTYEPVVLLPGERGDSALPARLGAGLRVLLTAGGLVLLVACMNVANLQLARNEARRLELAVRAALGARRQQLARLMIVDALLLAFAAGIAGIAAAALFKDRAASLIALWGQPVSLQVPIDWRVVATAVGLSIAAALVVALLSTWQMLRARVAENLQDARHVAGSRRRIQKALVVAQFALSMALLSGAALLVRTIGNLRGTDLGFDAGRVAVLEVSPEMGRLSGAAAVQYFEEVIRVVSAVPGVQSVSVAHVMPLDFGGSRISIEIAGYTPHPDEDMEINFNRVTPEYFRTLGIPVLRGRAFDERDRRGEGRRIIVNETMARRFWPDGDAVGRMVRLGPSQAFDVEVVGVVADAHYRMVREKPRPSFYAPLAQLPVPLGVVHVRVHDDPAARLNELRRVVGGVHAAVPVTRSGTLRAQVERNIADERLAGAIGLTLGAATLLLAAAGLYATMAFLVGRRTREIGVRMALGARATDVRQIVMGDAGRLVALGIAGGLALALWVGHTLRSVLYGVSAFDYTSMLAAAGILGTAAVVASWLPARRAANVDPLVALRE